MKRRVDNSDDPSPAESTFAQKLNQWSYDAPKGEEGVRRNAVRRIWKAYSKRDSNLCLHDLNLTSLPSCIHELRERINKRK